MNNENCVFCKIVNGEIQTEKIYEDDEFISFLDINPISKGHSLIIPKNHTPWMHEVDDQTISNIFILAKKIMKNKIEKIPCDYVQVGVAGNEVSHFHVHLIPRHMEDNINPGGRPSVKYDSPGEIEAIINKLKM